MRIVQVCPYDLSRHGGVQQHIRSLSAELRKGGHEVLVIAPGSGNAADLQMGRMRRVSMLGTSFEFSLASTTELQALDARLAAWRADVVHYHTIWVPILPWQIFRRTATASVATFHDTPPPGISGAILRATFKILSRFLLRSLDGAIAVSPAPLTHLRSGRNAIHPVILPPATDLSDFFALNDASTTGKHTVLFVGRLEPRKGIRVLLDAWEMIADGRVALPPNLAVPRLVIAGSGELETQVGAAAQRLGDALFRHVPAPNRENQLRLLAEASLLVSPALYGESFGIVLVEALASGTPTIAAANAGYSSVLKGLGRDLLVPPGDAAALAEKIVAFLANDAEREKFARLGREHASQFDISRVMPDIMNVYRKAATHYARSNSEGAGNRR